MFIDFLNVFLNFNFELWSNVRHTCLVFVVLSFGYMYVPMCKNFVEGLFLQLTKRNIGTQSVQELFFW